MTDEMGKVFELVAGNVALDLVNTLDFRFRDSGSVELLGCYDDLLRFTAQSGLLSEEEIGGLRNLDAEQPECEQTLSQVKDLRERLSEVLYAWLEGAEVPATSLASLEGYFKQAAVYRRLVARESHFAWEWQEMGGIAVAPLWLLAQAARELVSSIEVEHLRSCASDTCRWLFLDKSKSGTRRWCDMKVCGNRMKAKRFQARRGGQRSSVEGKG